MLVLAAAGFAAWHSDRPSPYSLLLVAAVFIACRTTTLHIRTGHDAESFDWSETAIVIALAMLAPSWAILVLALSATVTVGRLWHQPRKAIFNSAVATVGVGISGAVVGVLGTSPLVLVIATMSYSLWSGWAVSCAVAFSQGDPVTPIWLRGLALRAMVSLGNTSVGLGVGYLAADSLGMLLLLPPLLGLVFLADHSYLRAHEERERWQQLETASKALNRLDERAVADEALRAARDLFLPDWVELVVHDDAEESGARYAYVRHDANWRILEGTMAHSGPTVQPTGRVHVAILEGSAGPVGELRLGFGGPVRLSRRERQVLSTFAHTLSTAVVHSRLHARVLREASRHEYEASHDHLTGLTNRAFFLRAGAAAIDASAEVGSCTGLLLIDLDHFKEVNDALGHATGDRLLREVAGRLLHAVRGEGTVARLGGDEFAVLLPGLQDAEVADVVADRLLEVLAQPLDCEGIKLSVEASIGVAAFPEDGLEVDELLRRADIALYEAKESRGSARHYRGDRDATNFERLTLAAELRNALERDEVVLHFQPQVDLGTGRVVGIEVLSRWQHPTRGLLGPAEFIPVADHTGLARAFTAHVLEQAVATAAAWLRADSQLSLAVNLSARNLLDRQLPDDVARVLAKHGVAGRQLVLEITETSVVSDLELAEHVLADLRSLGVELSVDDFGTGYSSLALLQRIAVNEIKVDRSFVAGAHGSRSDRAIVRATVELGHSLGLRVVAEGVEDASTHELLIGLGCDRAQGYLLGRPVPATELVLAASAQVPAPRRPHLSVLSTG
jgi:diguanylate cyclase (GGDEF)-like protein